ncbi:hypothetical protein Tco_0738479 [Tanacetum coccineum]
MQHIKDMEIKLPGDLIEIPTKLESFTSTISSLSSQVAELKNIQWKPPAEFLNLSISDTLNSFSTVMENASGVASINVPSASQAPLLLDEGEKNTKDACTNLKNDLIDILGKDVVTQYYTKKLLFDRYWKMGMRKSSQISNVLADQTKSFSEGLDVVLTQPLTRKGVSSIDRQVEEEEASSIIKLEDLAKLMSNHKLELEKNKAEAEAALLKTQPSFPNVEQLKELLELSQEFLPLPAQVAIVQAKLKTLDALLGLLSHVTKALNKFAQFLVSPSSKAGDKSIPLAGQPNTIPAEGEKNTNQATIS